MPWRTAVKIKFFPGKLKCRGSTFAWQSFMLEITTKRLLAYLLKGIEVFANLYGLSIVLYVALFGHLKNIQSCSCE